MLPEDGDAPILGSYKTAKVKDAGDYCGGNYLGSTVSRTYGEGLNQLGFCCVEREC